MVKDGDYGEKAVKDAAVTHDRSAVPWGLTWPLAHMYGWP